MTKTALLLFCVLSITVSCSDDPVSSCIDICEAAQTRNCTAINDCTADCNQAGRLADKSNCQSERNDYLDCAESVDTCAIDANCASEEQAFGNCLLPYCLSNPGDSDCS